MIPAPSRRLVGTFLVGLVLLLARAGGLEAREQLESVILSLMRKDYVGAESRPQNDGRFLASEVSQELSMLARLVPRWAEAMNLKAADPGHIHTVGEHGLRALYHYAHGPNASALGGDRRQRFVAGLTVLLHDMGKLDSPRDAAGRQLKDPTHAAASGRYIRLHGRQLGLTATEREWVARMLACHLKLGLLDGSNRDPSLLPPGEREKLLVDLAKTMRTRENVEFLAAMTEADVLGANPSSSIQLQSRERLPNVVREVESRLPAATSGPN